tara:strand:+ start:485 stop:1312 length:828 start_codon:yes stop_codon:yes gene_type:complete
MSGLIFGLSIGTLATIASTTAAVGTSVASGIRAGNAKKRAQGEERMAAKKLEAFENSRQKVIDQSGKIREMKKQVFNPYQNLAVANKASELKIEQTDQALANTLDQINRSGTGAGGATALARMAAASKAQVGASLETQEISNQKLRAEGEAQADATKMSLEQKAIAEETSAWGRQETRDLTQLDRLAGQQENAQAQAQAYADQQAEAYMGAASAAVSGAANIATSGVGQKSGVTAPTDPITSTNQGYGEVPTGTTWDNNASYNPNYDANGNYIGP